MKRLYYLFLLSILFCNYINAQWDIVHALFGVTTFTASIFVKPDHIWLAGSNGKILKSSDKGKTWKLYSTTITGTPAKILFLDSLTGYCLSDKKIFLTIDGGENWHLTDFLDGAGNEMSIDFHAINKNTFLKTGSDLNAYKSIDSGRTWSVAYFCYSIRKIQFLGFTDENNGFMQSINAYTTGFDRPSTLCKTTNGGSTWTEIKNDGQVLSFYMLDNLNGWFFFSSINSLFNWPIPHLSFTTDAGNTWTSTEPGFSLTSLQAINKYQLFGLKGGTLTVSSDGGNTWNDRSKLPFSPIAFYMFDELNGMTISSSGLYSETTDGGLSWSPLSILTNISRDAISNSFLLKQNYPNPFNPETTISYSIPSRETLHAASLQMVTLKVFDILGREISTLVNEAQSPGTYSVIFNARNLPSGIYLYTINAGSYSESKKMILLR